MSIIKTKTIIDMIPHMSIIEIKTIIDILGNPCRLIVSANKEPRAAKSCPGSIESN
jgi:hypothetical protein